MADDPQEVVPHHERDGKSAPASDGCHLVLELVVELMVSATSNQDSRVDNGGTEGTQPGSHTTAAADR